MRVFIAAVLAVGVGFVGIRLYKSYGPLEKKPVPPKDHLSSSAPPIDMTELKSLGQGRRDHIIQRLIRLLREGDPDARLYAAQAFAKLKAPAPDALDAAPDLIRALKDEHSMLRASAVDALGVVGPSAKEAIPALVEILENTPQNADLYRRAVRAIDVILDEDTPVDPTLTRVLAEVLKHQDAHLRRIAAASLRKIATPADEAVSELLVQALDDEDETVRRNAAESIERIGDSGAKAAAKKFRWRQGVERWANKEEETCDVVCKFVMKYGIVPEQHIRVKSEAVQDESKPWVFHVQSYSALAIDVRLSGKYPETHGPAKWTPAGSFDYDAKAGVVSPADEKAREVFAHRLYLQVLSERGI